MIFFLIFSCLDDKNVKEKLFFEKENVLPAADPGQLRTEASELLASVALAAAAAQTP